MQRFFPRAMVAVSRVPVRQFAVKVVKTDDELRNTLDNTNQKLIVLDWSASWCGPCKKIAPEFEKLSEQYKDVVFLKADVDELSDSAAKAGVESMPTFQFIKDGELVHSFAGASVDQLKKGITDYK